MVTFLRKLEALWISSGGAESNSSKNNQYFSATESLPDCRLVSSKYAICMYRLRTAKRLLDMFQQSVTVVGRISESWSCISYHHGYRNW